MNRSNRMKGAWRTAGALLLAASTALTAGEKKSGPPVIVKQPKSVVLNTELGETDAKLVVNVTGSKPFSYRWRFNEVPLEKGGDGDALNLKDVEASQVGYYSVVVSNRYGEVVSDNAFVGIAGLLPVITEQPQSQLLEPGGDDVTLRVSAYGSSALSYRWTLNGNFIPGANSPELLLSDIQPVDGGDYQAYVISDFGFVESDVATLQVVAPPVPFADMFAHRGTITGSAGTGQGNNYDSSKEEGEPTYLGLSKNLAKRSVWVSYLAPEDGVVTLSTAGSNFDTILAVFTGETISTLGKVAEDDDSDGYLTSYVSFNVEAGQRYEVAVTGFDNARGNIVLSWQLTPTQDQVPRIVQGPLDKTLNRFETLSLTVSTDLQTPIDAYQWHLNGQPIAGQTQSTLSLSNLDDADTGRYTVLLTSGSVALMSAPAEVQINTEGITTVTARDKMALSAFSGFRATSAAANLNLNLNLNPQSRDGRTVRASMASAGDRNSLDELLSSTRMSASRRMALEAKLNKLNGAAKQSFGAVSGYTGTQVFSTDGAGKDPGEPNHCGILGGSSYWFSYQAPAAGEMFLDTDGSLFDTILAVYVDDGLGNGYNSLHSVTCDNDSGNGGHSSALSFNAEAGAIYYVVIDGVNGATGIAYLNYNLVTAGPSDSPTSDSVGGGGWGTTVGNEAPLANPDEIFRSKDKSVTFNDYNLLNNDYDADGDEITLMSVAQTSANGRPIRQRGSRITYYGFKGDNRTDSFTYTIRDTHGNETVGVVTVSVK